MSINIDIPEAKINNAIAVALAESFSEEKRDSLLRDIIRAHLQYKANSYDKETLLSKTVHTLLREMVSEKIEEIITNMKPEIDKIVEQTLGKEFQNSILDKLKSALKCKTISNLYIDVDISDEL